MIECGNLRRFLVQACRLYKTLSARFGWVIAAIGVVKWIADWWGRGSVMKEWASYLPQALRFLAEPWITPVIVIAGLALVFWAVMDEAAQLGFDNVRWLPEKYRKKKIPH